MDHSQCLTTPLHQPSPSNKSRISLRTSGLNTSESIPPPTDSDKNQFLPNVPTLTHVPGYNDSDQFLKLRLIQAEAKIAELEPYKDMYNAMINAECEIDDSFTGDELSYLKRRNAQLVKVLKQVKVELEDALKIKAKLNEEIAE